MFDAKALLNKGVGAIKSTQANPVAVSAQAASTSFNLLVSAWKDYKQVQAVETTKRAQIKADKEVAIKAIEEQASLLRFYFDKVFAERQSIIDQNFSLLSDALAKDNLEMAALAMNSINQLVAQSPLAQAQALIANINNKQISHVEI